LERFEGKSLGRCGVDFSSNLLLLSGDLTGLGPDNLANLRSGDLTASAAVRAIDEEILLPGVLFRVTYNSFSLDRLNIPKNVDTEFLLDIFRAPSFSPSVPQT